MSKEAGMYLSDRPRPAVLPDAVPGPRMASTRERVGRTVVLMGLVSLVTDISSESLSAILPLYVTAVLGLSPLAYGVVDGVYQGAGVLVRIAAAWVSDVADRPKWVALSGYAMSAFAKAALLLVSGFAALTAVVTVDRLGKGIRTAPRDAVISAVTPPAVLGRAFGVHRALDSIGAAIGPLVAFALLALTPGDYTPVIVVSLAFGLIGVALLGLVVPDVRPRRVPREAAPLASHSAPGVLRDPALRRVVAVAGVLGLLTVSDGFLYLTLQRRDDFAAQYFPLLFVATNVVYFLLAVPMGRLADRLGRHRLFALGHLLLVAAYAGAARETGGLAATGTCLLLLGAFYAATDGVLSALTSALSPVRHRALCLSATQTATAIGRLVSSIVFGLVWVEIGRGQALSVFAVALSAAVGMALWLFRGLPTTEESRVR
jgi:MFS family permease